MGVDFPDGWSLASVEECMAAIIDYRGKSPAKTTFGVPLITAKVVKGGRILPTDEFIAEDDYESWMRRGLPQAGDVVITTEAPLGEVAQLDGTRIALAQRLIALRGKTGFLDNTYLKFALQSGFVQEQLASRATGTTVLGIRQSELRKVLIPIPPPDEQRRIAHVLGTLDDKIELNRRMNETLEAMARTHFKSWFVDFDPVRAKVEGRQPPGMYAATAAFFPDSFEDSTLGPIPKGWSVRAIREVVAAVYDGPHATPPEAESGAIFLGIDNLTGTSIDLTKVRHIGEEHWQHWTRRVTPQAGDIVFSYEATLGYFALIPPGLRCCLGRRLALVRPQEANPFPRFLLHTFVSESFQAMLLARRVQGSTVDRIPLLGFPTYPMIWPERNLISKFEEVTEPIWGQIHRNQGEVQTLAAMRDALLPKLLSGEVKVPDHEPGE